MARIPYADLTNPEAKPLVERIVAERGEVLHLYQMLLHSPPVAEGWLKYLTAIRQQCQLSGALRELVIMRVAQINGAPYEADQHRPYALREGVSEKQLDALQDWSEHRDLFDEMQRAVLAYTDAMTRDIHVPEEIAAAVREEFDHRTLVELTATIAAYNMVSRFLEAMAIHSDDDTAA
ncbi:carboxymuconolactone decarboxylase family protein [Orrella marina]|uniref:Carboxymuconolactone decarboxylase n=1 Tax=Orrella marina TaxID=2163011 RepID=A0A2R4XNG2_9BURK|nr:carboxymuconolactone decarboxylase family protein [Orrella marina]AWB35352.1 carboxymuconolactone decarboxylase [Orrella marina]